jgi:hypothetical protein
MVKARAIPVCLLASGAVCAAYGSAADTDRDGLSDQFEQALLQKFAPRFHISAGDDITPAEFHSDLPDPRVKARNERSTGRCFRSNAAASTRRS